MVGPGLAPMPSSEGPALIAPTLVASPADEDLPGSPAHPMGGSLSPTAFILLPGAPITRPLLLPPNSTDGSGLCSPELLHHVFNSMAIHGRIMMGQLPFVLTGAEVQATAEEVQEAIEKGLPDVDDTEAMLDFDQVQTVYHRLAQVQPDRDAGDLVLQVAPVCEPSAGQGLWRWLQRKRAEQTLRRTAFERQMKPTARLLLLILLTACVISAAVVVFSVVLIFNHSNDAVVNHLVRNTNLLSDGLNLFGYTRPFEHATRSMQQLSAILSVTVGELGYATSQASQLTNLASQRDTLADLLDGWYASDAAGTVDLAATVAARWVERLVARGTTLRELVAFVDAMNPSLPPGEELQLAQNTSSSQPRYLMAFRFATACVGVCGANGGSTAVRLALAGNNGTTLAGSDYRPQAVVAGYRLLANPAGVALVYSVEQAALRAAFQPPAKAVVDALNARLASESNSTSADIRVNSMEVVLSTKLSRTTQNLTTLRFCNASCLQVADLDASSLALATNTTWQGTATDLNGEAVLIAYKPLPNSGLGLEVKVTQEEFLDAVSLSLGQSLSAVNARLPGTEELQLVTRPKPGASTPTNGMKYWTAFRFPSDCNDTCGTVPGTSAYLTMALTTCTSGTAHSLDYRSQMVVAGYFCLPAMKAAVAITIADSQIIASGISMAVAIGSYQNAVRYTRGSTEVAITAKRAGVTVVKGKSDLVRLDRRKFQTACPKSGCTGPVAAVILALNGGTGYLRADDYRWVDSMMAYTYLPSLGLGLLLKVDAAEAQAGSFRLAGILSGASVSAVIASMAVLALLANVLLKSMDRAWEEGKRAIEREKQAFRAVIEAMYPAEVAQRMLVGETHIVYDVPAATVFFSDIFEFTAVANAVTPEELIRFLAYTFGTMDAIGDHYHVCKVKTIGDAYLGVTGLPGMASVEGSAAMDMLLFASACAQVFSNRFLHPNEGTILAEVVTRMLRRRRLLRSCNGASAPEAAAAAIPRRPSAIAYGPVPRACPARLEDTAERLPKAAAEDADCAGGPLVHCLMRYGLAVGPITAGVLPGTTPSFDLWGKTVNLASRMESTGQAGRIQVAEGVYQAVIKHKNQPFTFEARHKVSCKGFGHVSAYFVGTCAIAPPKALLAALHIEPNWGTYAFHNPVSSLFATATPDPRASSIHSSASGGVSPRSASSQPKG